MDNAIVSTLKKSPSLRGGYLAYDANDNLIATISKTIKKESDSKCGLYRISWLGGLVHGKTSYALNFDRLNEVVRECAIAFFNNSES